MFKIDLSFKAETQSSIGIVAVMLALATIAVPAAIITYLLKT